MHSPLHSVLRLRGSDESEPTRGALEMLAGEGNRHVLRGEGERGGGGEERRDGEKQREGGGREGGREGEG